MNQLFNKIAIILLATIALVACKSDDMEYKDTAVTAVTDLYEPSDGAAVQLTAKGSLYFSWEPALAEDGGAPLYEVYFVKMDGDFSEPLYVLSSDLNGYSNGAAVTHKVMNKIAKLAGAKIGESVDLKWAVISARGINTKLSTMSRTLSVTRMNSFEDTGVLYITGEGCEAGDNLMAMHRNDEGEYEIYTKLIPGKAYYFRPSDTDTSIAYYINGAKLEETVGTFENTLDGVYKVSIDLNSRSVTTPIKVEEVGFWFCPNNKVEWTLDYIGNGTWEGKGPVNFKVESWGKDQRYKFRVKLEGEVKQDWGPAKANEDGTPSGANAYYNLAVYDKVDQWDPKWKFAGEFDGVNTTLTVIMSGTTYTHKVSQ